MPQLMPYHLEKGPTIRLLEQHLNGTAAEMRASLDALRASVDKVDWVIDGIPGLWDDPLFQHSPLGSGQGVQEALIRNWLGFEDVGGVWQRANDPDHGLLGGVPGRRQRDRPPDAAVGARAVAGHRPGRCGSGARRPVAHRDLLEVPDAVVRGMGRHPSRRLPCRAVPARYRGAGRGRRRRARSASRRAAPAPLAAPAPPPPRRGRRRDRDRERRAVRPRDGRLHVAVAHRRQRRREPCRHERRRRCPRLHVGHPQLAGRLRGARRRPPRPRRLPRPPGGARPSTACTRRGS